MILNPGRCYFPLAAILDLCYRLIRAQDMVYIYIMCFWTICDVQFKSIYVSFWLQLLYFEIGLFEIEILEYLNLVYLKV